LQEKYFCLLKKIAEVRILDKSIAYWNNLAVEAITEKAAFAEMYQHFFPRVYKFILGKTADADIADEIISETFLKVYEHLADYDSKKAAFSTWLFRIAENELKMYWRSKNYRNNIEEEWDEEFNPAAPDFEEPEQKILQVETQNKIKAALEKLPERERKIIEMTYWLNYPPRKIAEILDLTPNHVSVLLKRAKNNLKNFMS
jgi:RNA polymerase sigma-70 factor (ECF subfamily)